MAHEYLNRIRDLEVKYEQEIIKNKRMQEYVNYFKNSYLNVFDDAMASVDPITSTTSGIGIGPKSFF